MKRPLASCIAFVSCMLLAACGDDDAAAGRDAGPLDASADAADDGGDVGETPYLTELVTPDDYASLAVDGELRYLAPIEGATPEPPLDAQCVFQNMGLFDFHIQFMVTLPAYRTTDYNSYLNMVLRRGTRVFYGGLLKQWLNTPHPVTGRRGVISYGAYQADQPGEEFTVDELVFLHERMVSCVPFAEDLLVFVPDGATQIAQLRSQRQELLERGVPVLMPEELL